MSKAHPSNAKPPAHHTKMLAECIAAGWIKRVGDSYEITPAGHAYTLGLTSELPTTSTFEGNDEPYDRDGYGSGSGGW